jgi:alkylation response protein AidB-like acyl-CoA dehydrogenase
MKIELSDGANQWAAIARKYADEYLQPHEVEAELNDGVLPGEITSRNKKRALELGFAAIDVPGKYGGLELPMEEQVAIWEQLGRVTNALSWCFSEPQSWMFEACNEEQIERYILPMMRGERKDCYAITESGPGSDVAGLEATATKDGADYILNGEKWYVTSGNLADFIWFQARVPDEDDDALFLVDQGTEGAPRASRQSQPRNSLTPMPLTTRHIDSMTFVFRRRNALVNQAPACPTHIAGFATNA